MLRSTIAAILLMTAGTALHAQETVRLSGEVRVRGEAERTVTPDTADSFSLLRTRLAVEALLSPRATVFAQVQDARVFGEETSTVDGSADRIDLHQAWLQYAGTGRLSWSVRAGRQEIALGNERLVGAVGWSNTGRSFDGVRAALSVSGWSANVLAATIRERGARHGAAAGDRADHMMLGAFVTRGPAELFVLHDREDAFRVYSGVDRTTLGARIAKSGALTASLEGAWQLGHQLFDGAAPVSQDIGAYMAGARVSHDLTLGPLARAGVGVDVLSGDDAPYDDSFGAFHTLYATNHKFYGYQDLFLDPAARTRDRGLIDGMLSATIALPRALALEVDGHAFWLQRGMTGATTRALGMELDLTLPVRLGPGQQLQLGYSAFRNGGAAPLIGLGSDGEVWHWTYLMATFSFGARPAPIL